MKRTSEELATLSKLLDAALELPAADRAAWVEELAEAYADLKPTLRRLLLSTPAGETSDIADMAGIVDAAVRNLATQSQLPPLQVGGRIGPYELIRELGQGGMGSVWLAERADGAFKRSVALKLPHISWIGGFADRMARERDILASLEHPNIARFYDAGVDEFGRPFMAMEYVEGQPIDVYCREKDLSIRDTLTLILQVSAAVAHAHTRLVVHRDLKPSNMLVTADGAVRLLDFGIAKLLEGDAAQQTRLTRLVGRALTPDYASPEQIGGEPIGTATDVYSLAVVTYELLTGARPYKLKRGSVAELEEAIAEADPLAASEAATQKSRKRQLRGDLDAVLNKALKKDPAARYSTADAFANDVRRYLTGETVLARPDSAVYRLRKFARRNRVPLSAAAIIVLSLVIATGISVRQAKEATRQAAKATAITDFLMHVFTAGDNRAAGSKPPGEVTALQLLDQGSADLVGALDTEPEVKIDLIEMMADIYAGMDATDKQIALYQAGVAVSERAYGSDNPRKAELLAHVADGLSFAGRYADCAQAIAKAERAFETIGDHTSLEYANLLKLKGNLLRRAGPHSAVAARETLQRAAALFAARYPDEESYAGVLMTLANTDVVLDRVDEAKQVADTAVVSARRRKGDELELAHTLSLRASVEDQLGDVAGAERDYLEASKLYAVTAGTKHFFYLQNENYRGQMLQLSGRRAEGLPLLEATTAQISAVRHGSNTEASSLERLASAYLRDGSFESAAGTALRVLGLETAKQYPLVLGATYMDQARALTALGHFAEANASVDAALRLARADGQPTDFVLAEANLILAAIANAAGAPLQARKALDLALSQAVGETRRVRMQRARILLTESQLVLAQGELPLALQSAVAARKLVDAADIRSDVFLRADVLAAQGEAACSQTHSLDGAKLLEDGIALRTTSQRADSPLLAQAQIALAGCLLGLGRVDRARELAVSAHRILDATSVLGPQFTQPLRLLDQRLTPAGGYKGRVTNTRPHGSHAAS